MLSFILGFCCGFFYSYFFTDKAIRASKPVEKGHKVIIKNVLCSLLRFSLLIFIFIFFVPILRLNLLVSLLGFLAAFWLHIFWILRRKL